MRCLASREEFKLQMFGRSAMRKVYEPQRDEVK
jgi:hypothetical protein